MLNGIWGGSSGKCYSLSSGASPSGVLTVQDTARSWTRQGAFKGNPVDDWAVDKTVSSALSAGDKTPRNLWKVPEKNVIQIKSV